MDYQSRYTGEEIDERLGLAETAYQLPGSGIPKEELSEEVRESLDKADRSYQMPEGGIPKEDMSDGVKESLEKADTAYQLPETGIPAEQMAQPVQEALAKAESAYQKPGSGIPSSDLDEQTQQAIAKAEISASQEEVNAIREVIPEAATPENQLADKDFVNGKAEEIKTGRWPSMTAGAAENILSYLRDDTFMMKRLPVGVASGSAFLQGLKGNSAVWNQPVQNGNFADGTTGWECSRGSISVTDGILSAVKGATAGNLIVTHRNVFAVNTNHKYYATVYIRPLVIGMNMGFARLYGVLSDSIYCEAYAWNKVSAIFSYDYNNDDSFGIIVGNLSQGDTLEVKDIQLIDLTLMFGSGNEPSTVADFEAWMAKNIGDFDYLPYNAGEILCVKMTGVKSIGTGVEHTYSLPVQNIYGKLNGEGNYVQVFPGGMRQADYAGTVKDAVSLKDAEANVKCGNVNLGTLTGWAYISDNGCVHTIVAGMSNGSTVTAPSNILCSAYETKYQIGLYSPLSDKTIQKRALNTVAVIMIKDSAHTTAPTSQDNWVDGMYIVFELATPLHYTDCVIAESAEAANNGQGVSLKELAIAVEEGGSLQVLPQNAEGANPTTMAPVMTLQYPVKPSIGFIGEDSQINMLEALKAAGRIAGYTRVWNPATGQYDYTFS